MIEILKTQRFKQVYANDINRQLINTYITIQRGIGRLLGLLEEITSEYKEDFSSSIVLLTQDLLLQRAFIVISDNIMS